MCWFCAMPGSGTTCKSQHMPHTLIWKLHCASQSSLVHAMLQNYTRVHIVGTWPIQFSAQAFLSAQYVDLGLNFRSGLHDESCRSKANEFEQNCWQYMYL